MNKQFIFDEKHKRSIYMGIAIGVVLLVVGLLLSNLKLGESHGAAKDEHAAQVAKGNGNELLAAASRSPEEGGGEKTEEASAGSESHGKPEPSFMAKLGSVTLIGNWYWILAACFGVFFITIKTLANAGWYVVIKRILEAYYMWMIPAIVLMLGFFFLFKSDVYLWAMDGLPGVSDVAKTDVEELIEHKAPFLNAGFYATAVVGILGFYFLIGHLYRKNSLVEEKEGGTRLFNKNFVMACVFLPVFAFSFSMICFQWIMSIDVVWFSTIFGVYNFAGMFVLGATITALIVISLKEKGYLENVTANHLHDLGKFMFAFSVFWAYIWTSQYLLIWYANMPEETIYYTDRYENYQLLFWLNFILNFITPFIGLMKREIKRQADTLKRMAIIMLVGRFLDIFLLVIPGTMGEHWNLGLMIAAAGMVVVQGGMFFYLVYTTLAKAPLVATNHPYYQESLHHDTGV